MAALLLSALLLASAAVASAYQFEVGDETGWIKPTGKERHSYNDWAAQNRFHIHDTLHFKYAKDSVMEVSSADYLTCNTSNPIAKFEHGSTVYELSRPGFFYFISGQPGHCKLGQRLIVRVMHPLQPDLPPASAPTGGDSGWPEFSSTAKLSVVSYFVAAFVALAVTFWLFL
ncbi:mavicyanin-like [Salvia hispanica]|uniref:mavicyanin-like n=1 Tax=Salvia hispanica TaxID=49212 RepID=UPI002009500E|nr:mavicyanin-like [Salvia hispanica]